MKLLAIAALCGLVYSAPATPEKFGAEVSAGKSLELATILKDPEAYSGKTVIVEAMVRSSCTQKGCWMELSPTLESHDQGCRVTFKNYGFFVPKGLKGARSRVEGTITLKTVTPEQVKHWEGEGATFAKKFADGSAREVQIVATGVELWRQ